MRSGTSIVSDKKDPQCVGAASLVTGAAIDELAAMTLDARAITEDAARINAVLREKLAKGIVLGSARSQGVA